jgi:tetratricopeptide (TPR) repeat protein
MNPEAVLADSYRRLIKGDALAAEQALAPLWNASGQKPAKVLHLLALIRRSQKRIDEAERLFRLAIEAAPHDAEQHNNLGDMLLHNERAEAAIVCFREALRRAPQMDVARLNLARALNAIGRGAEAEPEARAVLARKRTPEACRALGSAVGLQGRHKEALAAFEEALALRPGYRSARQERGIALHKVGRSEEGLAEFMALAKEGPVPIELYKSITSTLMEMGRAADAESMLFEAVRAYPQDRQLQGDLARLRWMRGENAARFGSEMERAVAAAPSDHAMRTAYAELLYRVERIGDAEAVLREGLGHTPEAAPLLATLGFLLDERGVFPEAVDTLRRSVALSPIDETRKLLAHALLRAGDAAGALAEIELGLKTRPHDQIWLCHYATALRMLGDPRFGDLYDLEAFVRVVDLEAPAQQDRSGFSAALARELDALHVLAAHPLNQTLREGTQTPRDLTEIETPAIQTFLEGARQAVRNFAQSLPDHPTHPFLSRRGKDIAFNGCWSVRLKAGGHHVNHVHHKGWISSAYYVRLPSRSGDDEPRAGWLKFGEPRIPIPGCTPLKHVEPKVGRLVLFPSYMWHGTEPFRRDDRLTIAFDAIPV